MLSTYLPTYLLLLNIAAFLLFGWDKNLARRKLYRIAEKNLFLVAIAGGTVGAIIGMYFFRHKTRHTSFVWGLPLLLLIQIILIACISYR